MIKKESFENFKEHANHSFSVLSKKVEKIMKISNLRFKKNSLVSAVYKQEAKIGRLILENQKDLEKFVKSDEMKELLEKVVLLNKEIKDLDREIEQAK